VSFWVAVEFFKVQHVSTPKTSQRVRKRMSENLRSLKNLEVADESEKGLFSVGEPRHSLVGSVLTPERIAELDLTEHQKAMLRDAVRIFSTFLEDGAAHWACTSPQIVSDIRAQLKSGNAVDISLFNKAQATVYATMQTDTFPRFLKAILDNPDKFSTGERMELPDDLREALQTVASQHEMLDKDALHAQAHAESLETMFMSPRISHRGIATVPEE